MRHLRSILPLACLLSHAGCQPTQPGDTDASTADTGGASTGPDATTGSTPTTGDPTAAASTAAESTAAESTTAESTTTADDTTGGDPSPTGDPTTDATTGDALDCSAPGTVHIVSPELGIEIHDEAAGLDVFDMQPAGLHGVVDGQAYYLWRDGDIGDGALDPGSHDVSQYPFHVVLLVGPEGVDCEGEPQQCQLIFGLAGAWDITTTQPFAGTLQATDLTADENCWDDGPPLDTSGCRLSKDPMQACFHVAWP